MIGWAAVTGDVTTCCRCSCSRSIFLWTPPHFWALSLFVRSDYASAGVPMLPVVAGAKATRIQILLYTRADGGGGDRALAARPCRHRSTASPPSVLSLAFLVLALQVLVNRATEPAAMKPEKRLFAFSILYLFAIFGALVADSWLVA